MTIHSPEAVRVALARQFRKASHIALPERAADDAMPIIREVLRERDEEIARLQELVTTYVMTGEHPGGTP